MSLALYKKKRHFQKTPEPRGQVGKRRRSGLRFVIQKHDASHLHYDFRLEWNGTLKSWAVPKGPSLDPGKKSLAVEVEDHPIAYGDFEGTIPQGEYGGGTVLLWDTGTWEPVGSADEGLKQGKIRFILHGQKLQGEWTLVRMSRRSGNKPQWLLMKHNDEFADREIDITQEQPDSVKSGRSVDQIARGKSATWHSNRKTTRASATKPSRKQPKLRKNAKLPTTLKPQLATWVASPPSGPDWLHEVKFDGYRLLTFVHGPGNVQMITRGEQDWTHRFPRIADELKNANFSGVVLDGEVVVMDAEGRSDFQSLQNALKRADTVDPVYYVFDLLFADGVDLRSEPLLERKKRLQELLRGLPENTHVRFSDHVQGDGETVVHEACRMHLEGVISKDGTAKYVAGRSTTWVKSKCGHRQEFIVLGYTDPQGSRTGLGALLLGYHDKGGALRYAGRVGTGFNREMLGDLKRTLNQYARAEPPDIENLPAKERRHAHWVTPRLVAEVKFNAWTDDNIVRQAAFMGLRQDKSPAAIVREKAQPTLKASHRKLPRNSDEKSADTSLGDVRLTHPDKLLFKDEEISKADLAKYYESVAPLMLPHVVDRPLVLLRCPDGKSGKCFFQRNWSDNLPDALEPVEVGSKSSRETHVMIRDAAGLIALVQVGVLEIHTWGSTASNVEMPDRLVFDLDPDVGLDWKRVIRAAKGLRDLLSSLKMTPFLKTTGGKGLHVVVPIQQTVGWDEIKPFCRMIAEEFSSQHPDDFTTNIRKVERKGRIFIDFLRNDRTASSVAPYSVRAREGAPVSLPIDWSELSRLKSGNSFTFDKAQKKIAARSDPWRRFDQARVNLRKIIR